uniref:hypothetical protein n=1 Tax=Nonomuraea sp. CA-252377 TaxID=3240003 RepID=UPI003F498ED2
MIERDDGLIAANDAPRYFAEPEHWSGLERWGWEQAAGRILDVPNRSLQRPLVVLAVGRNTWPGDRCNMPSRSVNMPYVPDKIISL